jgi:hypothetical protein
MPDCHTQSLRSSAAILVYIAPLSVSSRCEMLSTLLQLAWLQFVSSKSNDVPNSSKFTISEPLERPSFTIIGSPE